MSQHAKMLAETLNRKAQNMVHKNVARGTIETDGLGAEHRKSKYMGEPAVYARNLRLLTAMKGVTAEEACKGIEAEMLRQNYPAAKVDPKWYRRLMTKGASRSDPRTITQFWTIPKYFELQDHELWDANLITFQLTNKAPILPSKNRFAVHGQKLADLLEKGAGRYDYLMSLLDSLHNEAFALNQKGKGTNHLEAWIMPDKD